MKRWSESPQDDTDGESSRVIAEKEANAIGDRAALKLYIVRHKMRGNESTLRDAIRAKVIQEISEFESREKVRFTTAESQAQLDQMLDPREENEV